MPSLKKVRYISLALNREISFNERGIVKQMRPKSTLCWFKLFVVNCFSLMIKWTMQIESVSPETWTKKLSSHKSGWDIFSSKTKTWFCSIVIDRLPGCFHSLSKKAQTPLLSSHFITQLECQPLCCQNYKTYLSNYEGTESTTGVEEKRWFRNCT